MKAVDAGGRPAAVRWILVVLALALALVACGGGGGDDSPAPQGFEGTWRVSLREGNVTTTGGTVPGSAIPTAAQVAAINTESVAKLLGSNAYQDYTVVLSGATLTLTGPGTNLTVRINSVSTANYQACTSCAVGGVVSYDMSVNITASGTADGSPVSGTQAGTVTVIYTRAS